MISAKQSHIKLRNAMEYFENVWILWHTKKMVSCGLKIYQNEKWLIYTGAWWKYHWSKILKINVQFSNSVECTLFTWIWIWWIGGKGVQETDRWFCLLNLSLQNWETKIAAHCWLLDTSKFNYVVMPFYWIKIDN